MTYVNNPISIAVLGATGSIGRQVRELLTENYVIKLVSADKQGEKLANDFFGYANSVRIYSNSLYEVKESDVNLHYFSTEDLSRPETYEGIDVVVNGISGMAGILPSFAVLESGAKLITANKETFVAAGYTFMRRARELGAKLGERILPIDSEHSAIWACLNGETLNSVSSITITASGGAFRDLSRDEIAKKTAKDALHNPNWKMGKKVTVDTATLMNKGFELIEAKHLFGTSSVNAVIHRESIIHASVTFADGTSKLVYSEPDMRLPIQYALTCPERRFVKNTKRALDIRALENLTFSEPDRTRFPCYALAESVLKEKSDYKGTVLCAADEVAVELFLANKIGFYGISDIVESALNRFSDGTISSLTDIMSIYDEVREYIICNFGGAEC